MKSMTKRSNYDNVDIFSDNDFEEKEEKVNYKLNRKIWDNNFQKIPKKRKFED